MSLPEYLKNIARVPGWLTWYGESNDFGDTVDLYLIHRPPEDGQVSHVAKPVIFEMYARANRLSTVREQATLSLQGDCAVTLMTELWRLGVRPRGITEAPKAPEIAAIQAHLADMRNLVFRTPFIHTQPIIVDLSRKD